MQNQSKHKTIGRVAGLFLLLVVAVSALSWVSVGIWGGTREPSAERHPLQWSDTMTAAEFGRVNQLPEKLLKKAFGLKSQADTRRGVSEFGMSREQVLARVDGLLAIGAEQSSKDWRKIFIKFGLWGVFLAGAFALMARRKVTARNRKWLLLSAVVIFGVILGSDPSPMGTIKDAVVLLGSTRVVFGPRLIAFAAFLLTVILANKFICSWGCQLGTLQDLIFRLNRDAEDRKALLGQFKVPFAVSNGVRVLFFVLLTAFAFVGAIDIVEPIDPFKVFKPQALGIMAAVFAGLVLVLSLFVYRPWCHFFCPFGLVGWIAEKISVFRIKVDYDKCISCLACEKACPSTVMGAILRRDRVIPDCFSCGTCSETCPVGAISFSAGRRKRPPRGKFDRQIGLRDPEHYDTRHVAENEQPGHPSLLEEK